MEPEVANIFKGKKYLHWLRTSAKEINLETELNLAIELSEIMNFFREKYSWEAVSSNNIYWPKTPEPLSIIQVPLNAELSQYATIINPTMESHYIKPHLNLEGCGSIPALRYFITRPSKVDIIGYFLDDYLKGDSSKKMITLKPRIAADCAEHEIDHLWATLISDRGILTGYIDKEETYIPFDKDFPPTIKENASSFDFPILLRGLCGNYLPNNYMLLVLTAEQESSYWMLHASNCKKKCSLAANQLPMVLPDTPNMRQSLIENYSQYANTTQANSFSIAPMTLCDCMD